MFAAAQRRVFENMGDTGRVGWYSAQRHKEDVFRIIGGHMKMLRTGFPVPVFLDDEFQGIDAFAAHRFECLMRFECAAVESAVNFAGWR